MRRRETRRLRRHLGAATVGLTILGMVVPTAAAQAADPPRTPTAKTATTEPTLAAGASPGAAVPVTLVTGDRVYVGRGTDGKPTVGRTEAAPRSDGSFVAFHTITRTGRTYVVPNDALALLGSGVLDWSLFDIAELKDLVASGRTGAVPVIVTYSGQQTAAKAPKVSGASGGRLLSSINARSTTVAGNGTWWKGVRGKSGSSAAARSAGSLAGVEKVWLNGLSKINLDVSVPQIGADIAWSRGYDGKGVSVAVLDTGVDATHPDLADRVIEKADFTGEAPDAKDGHGHGTHVASTILGSGAASKGLRKGVAPGARLRIGKVCGDAGTCPDDAVIAGMEWAAHSGAKVVNMSLGGGPTDGTDPQSEALNRLSRETGTLFVVSAGNSGPDGGTVGSPGAADEALTVAAVDKKDKMAYFSSLGPRVGDYAPKPDIAAPGVAIVAARAAGTSLGTVVDDYYTTASGTSMASPHVAGAAAVVAQQHPDLTGRQIKALLMGTAKNLGYDANAQGVGRVALGEATAPQIIATGDLNFGRLPYAHAPVTRKVTYTNLTDSAATLDLTASFSSGGKPAPAGLVGIDKNKVSLPAGGSADVTVTLDGSVLGTDGAFGRWDGLLTARDTSGKVRATSRVHTLLEAERVPLTLDVVLPTGATDVVLGASNFLPVDDKDTLHDGLISTPGAKSATVSVYRGSTYAVSGFIQWRDSAGERHVATPNLAEVTPTRATTVTMDLRGLKPIRVRTPEPVETYDEFSTVERVSKTGAWRMSTNLGADYGSVDTSMWSLPTEKARTGTLTHRTSFAGTTPVLSMRAVGGGDALDLAARYQTPDASKIITQIAVDANSAVTGARETSVPIPRLPAKGRLPVVHAGTGTPAELAEADVRGKLVLFTPTDICDTYCDVPELRDQRVAAAAAAGAVGVLIAAPRLEALASPYGVDICPGGYENCPKPVAAALPVVSLGHAAGERLVQRLDSGGSGVRIDFTGRATPEVYAAKFTTEGRVSSDPYRIDKDDLARVDHSFHADRPGSLTQLTWQQMTKSDPNGVSVGLPLVANQQALTTFVRREDNAIDRFSDSWGDKADGHLLDRLGGETHDALLTRKSELHWNAGPTVPGAAPQVRTASGFSVPAGPCAACRQGDTFYPTLFLNSSGGGRQALIGFLDNSMLTETLFGITSCGPTAPPVLPTYRSLCDFGLSGRGGHEIERHRQHLDTRELGNLG